MVGVYLPLLVFRAFYIGPTYSFTILEVLGWGLLVVVTVGVFGLAFKRKIAIREFWLGVLGAQIVWIFVELGLEFLRNGWRGFNSLSSFLFVISFFLVMEVARVVAMWDYVRDSSVWYGSREEK